MKNILKTQSIDCIFLSYDEPNAERNWADLSNKAPWAKRVHGIKGSDAAHKACADTSDTEHFITVDGDNIVDPAFFNLEIDVDDLLHGDKTQMSWSGRNHINGLIYGNGGLKIWTREHVWGMRTHEAAEDDINQVDFCWDPRYFHMKGCYSTVHNNASELQAFRAGFREGVKMSLLNGTKIIDTAYADFKRYLPDQNFQRLLIWMSVGQDVPNGNWAIYGARLGCYMANLTDWDFKQVRDFDYLTQLFKEQTDIETRGAELKEKLQMHLNLPIVEYDKEQSKFFKLTYNNLPRVSRAVSTDDFTTSIKIPRTCDIVFISNGESNAEENYQRLLVKAPSSSKVFRVDGVQGIFNAHQTAAKLVTTELFYVVDADAWILDSFEFNDIDEYNSHFHLAQVYHSFNPVNELCYGYGAVKLFSKSAFDKTLTDYVDMTTTVGHKLIVVPTISNITKFNTDPFSSWRSAFRECAKLASNAIDGQLSQETEYRLQTWMSKGTNEHVLRGARAGHAFGIANRGTTKMQMINDYKFLEEQFNNVI
jgi:hypothetical protein